MITGSVMMVYCTARKRWVEPVVARIKNEHGASAVEFALVASLLLTLLFGFVVYGFYFATLIAMEQAASEGARAAVSGLSNDERVILATEAVNDVFNAYGGLIDPTLVTVTVAPVAANTSLMEVSITYNFQATPFASIAPFIPVPNQNPNVTTIVSNGGY